jgi:hypothetical protein
MTDAPIEGITTPLVMRIADVIDEGEELCNTRAQVHEAAPKVPVTEPKAPFLFHSFVDGEKMAEDVQVERANTLSEAVQIAARICPKKQGTVLVYADPREGEI